MKTLTLLGLCVSAVCYGSHSLRYYYTGVSAPGSGLPEFSVVGYVDDQQIDSYSSDTGRAVPVAQWMKENVGSEDWEKETQIDKGDEALYREEVKLSRKRVIHIEGFHFTQIIVGCELRDDGNVSSYERYSNDRKEFMYYDTQTGMYIPTTAKAQSITDRWNTPNVGKRQRTEDYLKNTCIQKLKSYVEYGREDLERRVHPGVKVSGQESGEITKLHCLVYGFHPRAVDVKLVKNGIDDVPSYGTTDVLPNPDGTYQIRVTVEVIPKEGDSYSCSVDHSSLEEPLLVKWERKHDFPWVVIISVAVIIVLVLVSAIAVLRKYKTSDATHEDSLSSASSVTTMNIT